MTYIVTLTAPVVLVPSAKLAGSLLQLRRDHPDLPAGLDELLADLSTRRDGVPVIVDPPRAGFTGN
ncbi:MAG: hypothetical protein ACRD0H_12515, partial [Actinomycetes bacterium]